MEREDNENSVAYKNSITGDHIERKSAIDTRVTKPLKAGVMEIARDGTIAYMGKSSRLHLGYEKDEVIGLPFDIMVHPDMPHLICEQAFAVADKGGTWGGFLKAITRHGEYFWAEVTIQPRVNNVNGVLEGNGYAISRRPAREDKIAEVESEFRQLKERGVYGFVSDNFGKIYAEQFNAGLI